MSRSLEIAFAAGAALLFSAVTATAQDVAAGEKLFAKCRACHAVGEGAKNKIGPQLNGLIGRTAGTAEGYKYSPAMLKAGEEGLVWEADTLKAYLADPKGFVKGNKMAFAGLKKDDEQANMIAYLATFSTGAGDDRAASEPAPAGAASEQTADAKATAPVAPTAAAPTPPVAAEAAPAGPAAEGQTADGLVLGLGRAATDEEIAAWDIDIRPDGLGLPVGKGTVSEGEPIYEAQCASCHGDFGEAVDRWPVLAGGHGSLQDDRPVKTIGSYWPYASTIYDFIRRAMPFGNARSLSDDEVYALTAYVLYLNDVVTDEEFELSNENFASVKLPNEPNFVPDDRLSEPHYVDKSEPCMADCIPGAPQISMHAAVLDVTPEDPGGDEAPAAGIE